MRELEAAHSRAYREYVATGIYRVSVLSVDTLKLGKPNGKKLVRITNSGCVYLHTLL